MDFLIFNTINCIVLLVYLESKEIKTYIASQKRKKTLVICIIITNIMFLFGIDTIFVICANILLISGYIDLIYKEIPNISTILMLVFVVISLIFNFNDILLIDLGIGLLIYMFFIGFCLLNLIGGGDIKIFLPLILLLGGIKFIIFLTFSSILVLIVNLGSLVVNKDFKKEVALAPYFYLSFMFILVFV